jgi:hypothetical protein
MSRGPSTFRQRDVKAAIKAVVDAGYEVARVEIGPDGKIIIVPTRAAAAGTVEKNPWDEILDEPPAIRPRISRSSRKG